MLFKLSIKFLTPCLGATVTDGTVDGACAFERDARNRILVPYSLWYGAIKQAFMQIGRAGIDPAVISIYAGVEAKTENYRRVYNRKRVRIHESVAAGQVVVFYGMTKMDDGGEEPFTKDELRQIFDMIGHFLRLSPWGRDSGYGSFNVIDLSPIASTEFCERTA